jgi:molybdate transport system substrate-binding protein
MAKSGDVTVFCDPTLAPAFRALDGIGGIGVSPLCAPAKLMLAQITRRTRDDVLFTLSPAMDQAVAAGLVRPESRIGGFCNRLVLAGRAGRFTPPATPAALLSLLAHASLAVTDATDAASFDGRAVLAANNLAAGQVQGAANTGDVAFLVTAGAADLGLVYMTDVAAEPRLAVVATLIAPPAMTEYAGAVNARAVSPNAGALLACLRGPDGKARLRAAGLQVSA